MPKVIRSREPSARAKAVSIRLRKRSVSVMLWSAGKIPTTFSGSSHSRREIAQKREGAVFLGSGSVQMFSAGNPGQRRRKLSAKALWVTM